MEYTKEVIRVGPSLHGQGVFALRSFTNGDYIGPISGKIVADPEYGSEYGIDLGDGERTLEAVDALGGEGESRMKVPICESTLIDFDAIALSA